MEKHELIDYQENVYKSFVSLPQHAVRQDPILDLYTSDEFSQKNSQEATLLETSFKFSKPLLQKTGLQFEENGLYFPNVHFVDTLLQQQYLISEQINQIDNINALPASFKRFYQIYQYELSALLVNFAEEEVESLLLNRLYQEGLSGCLVSRAHGSEVILFRSNPIKTHVNCFDLQVICSKEQGKIIFESDVLELPKSSIDFADLS